MKRIVVLGAGMVGGAIAADLAPDYRVQVVDRDGARLAALRAHEHLRTRELDLSSPSAVRAAVEGADLVIGALPGFLGFQALEAVISAGRNVVDISFFDEDPFLLDSAARERGVTAIVDCGVAPGMSNIILGHHAGRMSVESFECLVGGLPVRRSWPYQYKAPFSPIDVIEVYTRPARLVVGGQVVTRPALSDAEYVEFDPLGTLEAFNTDGLRTLLRSRRVREMKEKTLRYPGHIEYIRVLRESGFFEKTPIDVGGTAVRPLDLTARLLFPRWQLGGEEDLTVMRVLVRGREGGNAREYGYHLFDRYDREGGVTSMARTTGYTCTAVARLVLDGLFAGPGICSPEQVGAASGCFDRILDDLRRRGVIYRVEERETPAAAPRG